MVIRSLKWRNSEATYSAFIFDSRMTRPYSSYCEEERQNARRISRPDRAAGGSDYTCYLCAKRGVNVSF